ncbi:M3 family metallopeptidase [Shewanella baltica]|uniref:M3 family metallopeptidase n=1 Tax=Shewanella baltica TaxID=62322 RepID=UPI00217F0A96|nr:M3 family metallopeptidase [Shewanella baltica]MCS6237951.1 M3 family metallopeptidase [Shewanella baltica]MCS6262078.1 M3 family metallopeptidase [Shewanella baltica]MCS6272649.1 M3 family metallopeptidase [Shewanella baltica]
MRKSVITTAVAAALLLGACSDKPAASANEAKNAVATQTAAKAQATNVLLGKSPLQDQAPQFNLIHTADYAPAFEQGIKAHDAEIAAIVNNKQAASFDNTILAMETSGELLTRVSRTFFNLAGLISDDDFQKTEADLAPKLSAHRDNIYLDPTLFARVEAVYQQKSSLNAEDQRLVEYYYEQFVRAGAKLSAEDKAKMRDFNAELATLATDFSQNSLKSFKDDVIVVTDKAQLAGLSDSEIATLAAAAKAAGKEGYLITLVNTTRQPVLSSLSNRELRQKVWETSAHRAVATNGPLIVKMAQIRAKKANLLGFDTWASYAVADQMAKTPAAVYEILDDLAPKALARAKVEAADIQTEIKKAGGDFELQPWDWAYYADKVRKEKYDLDESSIKPYFEFNTVLQDGLFFAMHKLYGISLKPRTDLPVWNPDVLAFEVFDKDNSSIGLFYLDPYAREGKGGGAWMDEFVTQSGLLGTKPVVYNALNIPKPADGPTLMTFDEVTTMFHEMGHAVHGLFSQVKYPSVAGTSTARDFVEFPSQVNEDWNIDPAVIANYAKHYKTGEPIPKALLDKILASNKFGQGFDTVEYLSAALLDMEWHSISADTQISDVEKFEHQVLAKHGLDFAPIPPRYKSSYFSHAFSGGYSAGYYAYLWTEVFAADAFAYMGEHGGLKADNGDKFRKEVLSKGNSEDLMQDYIHFTGKKPTTDALLKRRGLVD